MVQHIANYNDNKKITYNIEETVVKPTIPLLIASSIALTGCLNTPKNQQQTTDTNTQVREQTPYLSQEQAAKRSARLSNVAYHLNFKLDGSDSFSNTTKVRFNLKDIENDLTLDLKDADVKSVKINGKSVTINYNKWFITLAKEDLRIGRNEVDVAFTRKHSTNGEGLHRMQDPVDGKVYLYSHFEPAAAQQMFAVFDQPDLKANYQMTVSAPKDWHVFTAMKETSVDDKGDFKVWHFDNTLKLSPYNFSLHAGPYHMWSDNSGKYPLRLFARESVAKQVSPEDWFKYTNQGLAFFNSYYGVDYPFRKYDQVLVPDFLYGAMENAAAITFAERGFLTNGEMTKSQEQRLASVIMHEMAHQWFGNLVTMKWWNGLWLNESFASFMATTATANATEFTDAWQSFYAGGKQAAYRQDQQVTTHPIEVPIPSSANAFDNIDAITYSKGQSVLKQLTHLLGEETFRKGIHNYLSHYAYQNAELKDFITSLGDAAGRDLNGFAQQWLYQPGVNTITANYQCEGGKITNFTLEQSADAKFPTLREQRVQVALYQNKDNQLTFESAVPVTYQGKSTQVSELVGKSCPDLVYPNYQDWGFVKVNLDERSFATAKSALSSVEDNLQRSMLWQSLWDSARDGNLPMNEYLDIAIANVAKETDYTILGQVLSQIASARSYLSIFFPQGHSFLDKVNSTLSALTWQEANANSDKKNMQRRWFSYYRSFANTPAELTRLAKILDGSLTIEKLTINQDLRWSIIGQLSRYNYQGSDALIDAELAKDNSDSGQKSAISARVIRPDAKVKAEWLAKIQDKNSDLPFSKLRTAMGSMYPSEQLALSEQTAEQRLASLTAIDKANDHTFMRSYANTLIPGACNAASVERLAQAIKQQTSLSAGTKRALLVTHQADEQCVNIRNNLTIK